MKSISILMDFARSGWVSIVHVLRVDREAVQEDCEFTGGHDSVLTVHGQRQHLAHILQFAVVFPERPAQVQRGFSQQRVGLQRVMTPDSEIQLRVWRYTQRQTFVPFGAGGTVGFGGFLALPV